MFVFVVLMTVFIMPSCSGEVALRYMSFNIRNSRANDGDNGWDFRKAAVLKMIAAEAPTVFGLQEACSEQLDYLDANLPAYSRVGVGRDDGKEGGEFCALYYRNDLYDLVDHGDFWLSETPSVPDYGWDAACIRIVTWACLRDKASGKGFYAFNTHLDHKGELAREQSVLLIINKIHSIVKDDKTPVILSGDFNSDISSSIFVPLKAEMEDSRAFLDMKDWEPTFNYFGAPFDGEKLIDYIFYKNAKVRSFKTLNGNYGAPYVSDHYPILADFSF